MKESGAGKEKSSARLSEEAGAGRVNGRESDAIYTGKNSIP
jgi:hypothetical protein